MGHLEIWQKLFFSTWNNKVCILHTCYFHKDEKARYSYKKTKRLEITHSLTRMDFICIYYIIDIATVTWRLNCWNSYRFITIYKSTYEFICLESHVNTEINLDLRVSNISGYYAAEGWINQVEISSTPNVVPLPVSTRTQIGSIWNTSAVKIRS